MSDVAIARDLARQMVQAESRGPGDTDNAMRRLAAGSRRLYRTLWALRYRPPSDLTLGAWRELVAAYERQCELLEARAVRRREIVEELRRRNDALASGLAGERTGGMGAREGEAPRLVAAHRPPGED